MKELLADLDRWRRQNEAIALATLVAVRGSAPRLPGSRLGLTQSGRMSGSVSAGCVESDVFEHAMKVLDAGRPALVTYGITDEQGFEVGLSCGGSIDVLIEPFSDGDVWRALRRAVEANEPAAWGIGLAPAPLRGRKLLVLGDEPVQGGIDPALDREVVAAARRLLPGGGTRTLTRPWGDEEATVFVEAFPPPVRLFIVGATHAAIHLCRMAAQLGFRVTVIDARTAFASAERFPEADEVLRAWPDAVFGERTLDAYAYVVTMTHDFKIDVPALECALRSGARYIGALGSRRTHERRKAQLVARGFGEAELARIRAPIGLDLGGRQPEEIALAILAEMLAVRHGREGGPLSARRATVDADG
ncbi:MAG: XdhC family protein [Myxococcales bacterium]|nr:XdhC family protein [Myxococcales bacterium]MDH3405301.1 XdhC family protein [Acidobacteriota bacterium]